MESRDHKAAHFEGRGTLDFAILKDGEEQPGSIHGRQVPDVVYARTWAREQAEVAVAEDPDVFVKVTIKPAAGEAETFDVHALATTNALA